MQQMTSTHAKQNFGEMLDALAHGPVAIERHKRIKAIVCTPETFHSKSHSDDLLAERRTARATQALVEKDRLIKHQKIALNLLLMPEKQCQAAIHRARQEVSRWRENRLCSADYIDRWNAILQLPMAAMVEQMTTEQHAWGTALRQNSPWHVVLI